MSPREILLVALVILIAGLWLVIVRYKGGLEQTFSQRVAQDRFGITFYIVLFGTICPLLFFFFWKWFGPQFRLPESFLWIIGGALLFQFLCTLLPERDGKLAVFHRVLTGISGMLLLPAVALLVGSPILLSWQRIMSVVVIIIMVALLFVALVSQKSGSKYALLLQIGYYALFFATILAVSYA